MDPTLGVAGALVLVIGYLLAANYRDRAAHQTALTAARVAYAADLAGLRNRLGALEHRLGELETELDAERERRRAAEDAAAQARRHH